MKFSLQDVCNPRSQLKKQLRFEMLKSWQDQQRYGTTEREAYKIFLKEKLRLYDFPAQIGRLLKDDLSVLSAGESHAPFPNYLFKVDELSNDPEYACSARQISSLHVRFVNIITTCSVCRCLSPFVFCTLSKREYATMDRECG